MKKKFRQYQTDLVASIDAAWQGSQNVLAVLPTGGGKTVVFADILRRNDGPSVAIAHRQELVSQISLALAHNSVAHRIIAPSAIIGRIVRQHVHQTGSSWYHPTAQCAVAGVDTLIRRQDELAKWTASVTLWVTDEAHHIQVKNKWGKACALFPRARGLGVTATPIRASGEGLGRNNGHGVFDQLVVGPSMRQLIDDGWLTDYRVMVPSISIDLSNVQISTTTGDFKPVDLKKAVQKSTIIGDVVTNYLKIARNKLGVCFASDVETATQISEKFRAAGVSSQVVSAKTPDDVRFEILNRFRQRKVLMLVNVDLFGEGFDLPAIEVVIMARPTESKSLFMQQFGRALRLMLDSDTPETVDGRIDAIKRSCKPRAIIIDHVGNTIRHGLPDRKHKWTLTPSVSNKHVKKPDTVKACLNPECLQVYERFYKTCPFCGHYPVPASRNTPEFVDGDLTELDDATLSQMRGEIAKTVDEYREELIQKHCPQVGLNTNVKRFKDLMAERDILRESIAQWAGYRHAEGRTDSESYRIFYLTFGVDVLSAQLLPINETIELNRRVINGMVFL